MESLDIVLIAKPDCLNCRYLAPKIGKKSNACKSDPQCPAQFYRLAIGVDMVATATELADAIRENDAQALHIVTSKIADLHKAVRNKIFQMAKSRLA